MPQGFQERGGNRKKRLKEVGQGRVPYISKFCLYERPVGRW
jgi:hypothetical protein